LARPKSASLASSAPSACIPISFVTSFRREIVQDFYFNVSINEQFDSKPPTDGTETNDLSLTTSFGWSF
ncbi:MAG: DUF481 domain-containing protein, partial [Gemmatimonadales bacterium]